MTQRKKPWTEFELGEDDTVQVRTDVDEEGIPFLDVQAVGATISVRPEASNHFRLYFWRAVRPSS